VVSFFESGPPQVRVNRPFLLVMRERFSGTVMYLGRVMDPR
jgi:serine protease inhibitor